MPKITPNFRNPFLFPECDGLCHLLAVRETLVFGAEHFDTIDMGRETCTHCGQEFLIVNDIPMTEQQYRDGKRFSEATRALKSTPETARDSNEALKDNGNNIVDRLSPLFRPRSVCPEVNSISKERAKRWSVVFASPLNFV